MLDIIDGQSLNLEQIEQDKLKAVFPQCFVEGKLDIDKLLSLCGEYITDDFERYEFKWKGKSDCLRLAQQRSTGTLRPCREESVNFDETGNLYIEGDNLEVLKLLQTVYYRRVKMIYIDPPYNTGNDFVYEDDFADPIRRYKEITSQTTRSNPETMGRYHTNWLNMMYPRLRLAANLLRDDGVIFISIDDNEVHNLRKLCDEVFGEENFIAQVIWQKVFSPKNSAQYFSVDHDYVICYARHADIWRPNLLPRSEEAVKRYNNPDNDPRGPWTSGDVAARNYYGAGTYSITCPSGRIIAGPPTGEYWRVSKEKFDELDKDNRIWWGESGDNTPRLKRFLSEVQQGVVPQTMWFHKDVGHTQEAKKELLAAVSFANSDDVFETPKPTRLVKRILQIASSPNDNDIILDFFSGSGSTAQAVLQQNSEDNGNRKFILVQLPEQTGGESHYTIADIGKERIRRAGAKILEEWSEKQSQTILDDSSLSYTEQSLDVGFKVFTLDSSNLKTWDPTPVPDDDLEALANRINNMTERVKSDRSDLDMVYEVMLKLGVDLCEPVTALDFDGVRAYSVREDCLLLVCLQEGITTELVERMADYAPARMVFGQSCFADITAMSNAKLALRDRGIDIKFV